MKYILLTIFTFSSLFALNKEVSNSNLVYLCIFGIFIIVIFSFLLYRQKIIKENEIKLQREKNRYQTLINLSSDLIFIMDLDGNLLEYSNQVQETLGYSDDEMSSLSVYDWDKNVSADEFKALIDELSSTPVYIERVHTKKDNSTYFAEIKSVKITILDKSFIYASVRDITKQKKILEQIQIEKARFENMFKTHDAIMLLVEPESGKIIDVNISAEEFYGYSYLEFIQMNIADINILDKKEIEEKRKEAKKYKQNSFIFPHKLKNQEIRTVEVHSSPIKIDDGVILFSIIRDITNEKILEQQIIKEKNFISTIIDNSNAIIAVIDNEARMFRLNKYGQEFVGYTQEEVSSEPYFWSRFLSEDKRDKVVSVFEKAKKGEIVKFFKNSWFSKSGKERIFEWSNTLVQKEDGTMEYLATIGIDITDREAIQKEILEQKKKFESIFKYSKDGIAITDLDTNFLEFNNAYLNMTGFSKEELLTKSCKSLIVLEQRENSEKVLKELLTNGHIENYEKECIVNHNRRIVVNMTMSLLPDKKRLLLVSKDVTSLKQVEDQLRLSSMGEMMGNIAHQWRQPLSLITTSAGGMKLRYELFGFIDKETLDYSTDRIIEQANYLSKTIDDFRNFIKDEKEFYSVSVVEIVESSLHLVEASLKNNFINIVKDMKDDILIFANKNELQQALINILNNSKDALKQDELDDDDKLILISTKLIDCSTLEFKILDSGGGIKEEVIKKIFEPYFTTKHQSQGTGLGLSMVNKIIRERHNFDISVHNEEFLHNQKKYKGACFTIVFKT